MLKPQVRRDSDNGFIKAVVGKVRDNGKGVFAVAYLQNGETHPNISAGESITFSLDDWGGRLQPRVGQVVLLGDVQCFAKGWRALSARPVTLEPQATATRKG